MQALTKNTSGRQQGMTLIESMVAMTISTVLILGSIQMYSQARSNYRTTESVSRMQENLRFSIDILDEDVRLAGFWGKASSAKTALLGGDTVTVTCRGNNVTAWVMDTGNPLADRVDPINALQDATELPDGCRGTNPRIDSDVLIIRHAETAEKPNPEPDIVQIQSNSSLGAFFDTDTAPQTAKNRGKIFAVSFSAYYISNESKYDPDLPSLRRLSLVGNIIEDQEIIPGVENLQVQFGIDTQGDDGQVDMYVNGNDPLLDNNSLISTRLWLLVRSEQNESGQGYTDNRGPYVTPDAGIDPIDPLGKDSADYPPAYRRMALTRTIVLRN